MDESEVMMPVSQRFAPLVLFFLVALGGLSAQAYLPDLKSEDLSSLDQRLKALGTTYRAQPLLAAYLATGQNPGFVSQLLEKGANPNLKASASSLSPLALAVTRNLSPSVVALLLQAGAALEPHLVGVSGNIIDIALERQQYLNANLLIKANQRGSASTRLVLSDRFKDYPAFFLDDLVQVRNILRYGDLKNPLVWDLALAGNSRKVLKYLIDFQIEPGFNGEGQFENVIGNDLLAANIDLLKYLLSDGLSRDEVNFDKLYQRLFAEKNLASVQALRAIDTGARPALYRQALAAGLDLLRAVTNNLADLSAPDLFDSSSPLVVAVYEKSDFATLVPLLRSHPSEAGILNLYRYAFAKKDLALLRNMMSFENGKVRPELYLEAIDAGIEPFKAMTHELADLKNPALYRDANQDGNTKLLSVLLTPPPGRKSLLEVLFAKTDFPTVLSLIQALNPPQEQLVGKQFFPAYQQWLNRANKDILTFGFATPGGKGTFQGTEISFTFPAMTDVTKLVAVFTLSGGNATVGGVPQVSGVTANDFTAPVTYLVVAQDGSKKTYTVTVTVPLPPPPPVEVPTETPVPAPAEPSSDLPEAAPPAP